MDFHKIKIWIRAIRPFAFSASLIPVLIAAALVFWHGKDVNWFLFPIIVLGAVFFHAGTNVVSEHFDFRKGVDKSYTFGSSRVLVEGLIEPKEVLTGGYILFAVGFLLGLVLFFIRGWPVLALSIIALLGGIFYSATPIGYKYIGFGDIMVFLLMGPLMVAGTYFTLAGNVTLEIIYVSLPIGFLVTAILNANNIRDIKYDRLARVKTMGTILGDTLSRLEYLSLVVAAYATVAVMIYLKFLPLWSLIVFLTLSIAVKNIKIALNRREDISINIVSLDVKTAQLHLLFGLLLFISIILAKFI